MSAGGKKKGLTKMAAHVGPNMTPMVDIVMCILIFFMLSMSFVSGEMFLTSNMAIDKKGLGTEQGIANVPAVKVTIDLRRSNDTTFVQAFQMVKEVGSPESEAIDKISDKSDRDAKRDAEKKKNAEIAEIFTQRRKSMSDDVQVIIAPGNAVPYQDVIAVYDACMKARFAKVAFRASN